MPTTSTAAGRLMPEVTLREQRDADADVVFDWMRDPVAVRMAAFTHGDPDDRERFDAWLARILGNPDITQRVIEVEGEMVGTIATFTIEGDREVTYWVDPARWGQGIGSAALVAMLALEPTRPLMGRAASANLGSTAVLRKAGFVEVGRDVGFAEGVGAEVEVTIFRLS
jgi:RimJ/RimL family protein N-acetyltransferase